MYASSSVAVVSAPASISAFIAATKECLSVSVENLARRSRLLDPIVDVDQVFDHVLVGHIGVCLATAS
jgi:hypothetical protein